MQPRLKAVVVISQPRSRGAAKEYAAAPRLMRVQNSYHGLQPWLNSAAAPRLEPNHSESPGIRRSEIANRLSSAGPAVRPIGEIHLMNVGRRHPLKQGPDGSHDDQGVAERADDGGAGGQIELQ